MSADSQEKKIDKKKVVDDICQAWFVSENMGTDDEGRVHYRSKEGVLSKEVVPPEDLHRLMEDPDTGLVAKAKQLAPDIEFTLLWTPPEVQEYAAQEVAAENERLAKGRSAGG